MKAVYRFLSTQTLITIYADEASRINQDDAAITKALIKKELQRRFDATLRLLDDPQTAENPQGLYKYLLNE